MKTLLVSFLLASIAAALAAAPTVTGQEDGAIWAVSCLGDSITAGVPYEKGDPETYPVQLQAMLDGEYGSGSYDVINRGVGGYTADQVLQHVQGWMGEDNADFVLLMVGGNDLAEATLPNVGEVISTTVGEVQDIVNAVTSHTNPDGTHPQVIVSAFTPNRRDGVVGSAAVAFYNEALEQNLTGYDVWFTSNWDDFYDQDIGQAKEEYMSDEVHPNEAGYQVMAENWFEAMPVCTIFVPLVVRNYP